MKKKIKKIIISTLLTILSLVAIYGIVFYFSFFQEFISIKDDKISSKELPSGNFESSYIPKLRFDNMPIKQINDISLNILGKSNDLNIPILLKAQRYYLPIDFICKNLNYSIINTNTSIILNSNDRSITLTNTNYSTNNASGSLRGNLLIKDNQKFISISDIEEIFGLTAIFKFDNKSITLLNSDSKALAQKNEKNNYTSSEGKVALIRLEDFTAGDGAGSDNNQPKLKALGDFLYSEGIKYHVAWIPRFKAPADNIDNDLLDNETFENASFINLLDYLINRGAQIGLHGYTHQSGDSRSAVGTELSRKVNNTEDSTRSVIESAIDTASALNIPYTFFESSHYKATKLQKKVVEKYFQYIYEPKNCFIYHKLQKTADNNLYIPTPLGYVHDLDVSKIQHDLSKPRPGELASLFYHPTKELDFIEISNNKNTFNVNYSTDSPLQKIVKSIKDNNYVTVYVNQLKNT